MARPRLFLNHQRRDTADSSLPAGVDAATVAGLTAPNPEGNAAGIAVRP
jgi:hypothetical protein